MELHKRIDFIADKYAISRAKLAKFLGIQQRTMNGYFSLERQHNFYPLLPKILELYPEISRDWLYFGEGEPKGKVGKADPGGWMEKYLAEVEAHRETLKKLIGTKERLEAALASPIVPGMRTVVSSK